MLSIPISGSLRALAAACALGLTFGAGASYAESVLRVAMSAADIPDGPGSGPRLRRLPVRWLFHLRQPDRMGLSHSDRAADIRPALAESWSIDPNDHKTWIFKLRKGVKFHDGCDWNADSAVWNFHRVMDPTSPQ